MVGVVVVTWRSNPQALVCVEAVRSTVAGGRIVVVDNESIGSGGAGEAVVLPQAENLGFAAGANLGIEHVFAEGATHAVLLNDDVLVQPGCVELLVAAAGDGGAASPRIDGPPGVAFAGGKLDHRRGFGRHVDGARDYLTAACLCISLGAWEAVGPFDEELFLYYEDVDWCLRARAVGVPLSVALEARAEHSGGSSSGGAQGETWAYYSTRNRLWLLERQRGARPARREAVRTSWRARGRALKPGGRAVAQAKLEGVRDWSERRMGRGPWPR